MKKAGEMYKNGQAVSVQNGDVLTYYFEDGTVKAKGKYVNGAMQGEWIFNKKEGCLWQVGNFDVNGRQHGEWTVYSKDGSVQKQKYFEQGEQVKAH